MINRLENIDTRIINFSREWFYIENNLSQSYMKALYRIVKEYRLDSKQIYGGIKVGVNFNVKNVKVWAFREYDYDGLHNLGVGAMYNVGIDKFNVEGIARYRYVFDEIVKAHNDYIYNKFSYMYEDKVYAKAYGAILLSYGSKTKIDNSVEMDEMYTIRVDLGARIGCASENTVVYAEPRIEFKYTNRYKIRSKSRTKYAIWRNRARRGA